MHFPSGRIAAKAKLGDDATQHNTAILPLVDAIFLMVIFLILQIEKRI